MAAVVEEELLMTITMTMMIGTMVGIMVDLAVLVAVWSDHRHLHYHQ